jgi:segregation and condensation protein A
MADQKAKRKIDIKEAVAAELQNEDEVSALSDYFVRLESFEGPFDLLLHMIDEDKIDIYTISLTQIIKGYIDYLKMMKNLDIVIASEFLMMAAYLIEMKSKMLLPVEETPEEGENVEEIEKTLLERLHEYKVFKSLAESLKERKEVFGRTYSRYTVDAPPMEEEREVFLTDVTLRDLVVAFQRIWTEAEKKGETEEIADEHVTVSDKIKEILTKVRRKKDGVPFEELFTRLDKLEVVVTFLAILELGRQRQVQIKQGDTFGSILIFGRSRVERS